MLAFLGLEVYISGLHGSSTSFISAASSQRIHVTCDTDACGRQERLSLNIAS